MAVCSSKTQISKSITNYELLNEEKELIPFSNLPQIEKSPNFDHQIFLKGESIDGLERFYEPVVGWKLDVNQINGPELFVESKKGAWIELLQPKRIYQEMIKSILITVHFLHFVKWNLDLEGANLWDHLRKVFDKFEGEPKEDDLIPHVSFIKEFTEKDEILAKSMFLKGFLERCTSTSGQDVNENDLFDNVCCICDNGGELLCCEGNCMRSFHANKKAGEESNCKTLGFSKSQLDEITNFICKNCELKQHQCFLCGKFGNSDKSNHPEVFQCRNMACGYFYHAKCISKELCKDDEIQALKCEKYISENGKFVCPNHKCSVCKEPEQKDDFALHFAMCRRCPKSYHRKCLPWEIAFQGEGTGRVTRAWEDLLPNNRILIYCMKHKIDKDLGTPLRNHIKFPVENEKEKEKEEKRNEKENEKEKEEKRNEKENSLLKRKRSVISVDPDYAPSLRINNIRIFEKQKIENRLNNKKEKEKMRRENKNREREKRKQEREMKKAERENKTEERENKKQKREKKDDTENRNEKTENKKYETENKTQDRENKNEERENKKEERENKRKLHDQERESEAKKICTGFKNTVQNQEPMEICHVYLVGTNTSEAKKSCIDVKNTAQNQEPMKTRHLYNLPAGIGGAGMSASVMDRYAPKLEETNLGRPGPPFNLGIDGFFPVYCYDMSGVLRRDLPPYKGPPPGSTCGWISD